MPAPPRPLPRNRRILVVVALALVTWFLAFPSTAAGAGTSWVAPIEAPATVVRGFAAPPEPWAAGHRGVDLAADVGAAVLAAGDGVVAFAGVVAGRGVISIDHRPPAGSSASGSPASGSSASSDPSLRTTYEPVIANVQAGQPIARGQRIGTVEPGGTHCPVDCLHWGLRDLAAEATALASGGPYAEAPIYRDPLTLLSPPRVRLLPRLPEPSGAQQTGAQQAATLPRTQPDLARATSLPASSPRPSSSNTEPSRGEPSRTEPSAQGPAFRPARNPLHSAPPPALMAATLVGVAAVGAGPLVAHRRRRLTPR